MDSSTKNKNDLTHDGQPEGLVYICGGCGKEVYFKPKQDEVSCSECGYRILYKKRTRAVMQYEAR